MKKHKIHSLLFLIIVFCTSLYANTMLDEDLAYLKVLYEQCYIKNYDDQDLGFNIDEAVIEIKEKYEKYTSNRATNIDANILANCLNQVLIKDSLYKDGHFYIYTTNSSFKYKNLNWNYAMVFFEKRDNEYYVKYSFCKGIKKKQIFTGNKQNLFKCIYGNQELYMPGLLSDKWETEIEIEVNHTSHRVKSFGNPHLKNPEMIFGLRRTDKTLYISFGDCYLSGDDLQKNAIANERIKKQVEEIKKKNYENIIIDLRGNYGGYKESYEAILKVLAADTDYIQQQKFEKKRDSLLNGKRILDSPIIEEKRNREIEKYRYLFPNMTEKRTVEKTITEIRHSPYIFKTKFKGKVIVLADLATMSAAEMFIAELHLFDNVILLGTNTMGVLDYGGRYVYTLPNSKIHLYLSCSSHIKMDLLKNNKKWHGDGKGFYPDYWTVNFLLKQTIIYITGDKQLNKLLKGIEKGLLL